MLWGLGVLAGGAISVVAISGLHQAESTSGELRSRSLPIVVALSQAANATATGQAAFVQAIDTQDPAERTAAITAAEAAGRTQDTQWQRYLQLSFDAPGERELREAYDVSSASARELAASLLSLSVDDPTRPGVLAAERAESAEALASLTALELDVYGPMVRAQADEVEAGARSTRRWVIVVNASVALVFTAVALTLMRGARRDQRRFNDEATALRVAGEQADLEGSLQRGLEMAPTEEAAYDVVEQALALVAGEVPAELLLADSSRAHFRQVLSTHPAAGAECRVGAPHDCPAANSAQTRIFEDSTQLDACRFLRGRDQAVWATCVPVSIGGRATGVIHAQRPLAHVIPDQLATALELVARKTGERVGGLRVLARTEAEAQVDPLTGLPNRRTLENEVQELRVLEGPFVVAFADLDHFKAINDAHGHDTGDRALRLFARVLRDSIRPRDLLARYGGEEFVAVLPDCTLEDARVVGERIRTSLERALGNATVPPFTVTIGLASAESGQGLTDVIANADTTMLLAKAAGRDRVVAAGELPVGPPTVLRGLDGLVSREPA